MAALQPTYEILADWTIMQKTSRGSTLRPVPGRLGKCSAQLGATRSDNHAVCRPGLCQAANDLVRLVTRLEPQQLTAPDRDRLSSLMRELCFLVKIGT
jgi:hypothetical protein